MTADQALLELEEISKRYGDHAALERMEFSVAVGEVFGFVGGNGAGKTTTMRIIIGVLENDSGSVRWRGRPIDAPTRTSFGYMPEERGLYPRMTVANHLEYLARLHGMDRQAARTAMRTWTERLDIAEHRDRAVDCLSLGNQQRVQLAAALVHDPQFLLLDEPFSGLDPLAVDTMSAVLRDKADEGVPVLFSSHQLDLVERLCDRVGIASKGRMVACGTVEALRAGADNNVYIEVEDAPHDWPLSLQGGEAIVTRRQGRGIVLGLPRGFDENRLLHHAMGLGRIVAFHRQRASLTELFRSAVTDETAEAA
ncbi:ABC transporter ATP-binding protein [Streptomyces sp. NPDC096033]|uniref:ABC transporter ATP-binding protein n=1 Tax=Streptomyces sp. NPDC096033 TaxID=3366071 RepID=UPI0037FB79F5